MKISIKNYLILFLGTTAMLASSCDSFLDRQEDEALTFDGIWEKRSYTNQYFLNAMSYIPSDADEWRKNPWLGASDEASVTYNENSYRFLNFGTWTPSNSGWEVMGSFYNGIRACTIFLQNADRCTDPLTNANELNNWKLYTRWARAYYYFLMMRQYGPVYLLGDELVDFTASSFDRPRNTWEECVNYVTSEMKYCADHLPDTWRNDNEKGLPTKGAALAVISRLKLYSARDLFNGNTLYASVKNPVTNDFPELSGVNLFPQTKDNNKWKEAAQAAKDVIDMGVYKLYTVKDEDGSINPYASWEGLVHNNWNEEIIWSSGYKSAYWMNVHVAPTGLSGTAYGGVGPTQQQVDAYAMSNGKYPITGYHSDGTPIIDETSGYMEEGKAMYENPYTTWILSTNNLDYTEKWQNYAPASSGFEWPTMYKDREPRFYMSVFWSDSYWQHGTSNSDCTLICFAKNGNSNKSHDYPKSGYLIHRFYDHSLSSPGGYWGNITFPTFRLGEIYLNYIEAALECRKAGVTSEYYEDAMARWDELRARVGLLPITDVYPSADINELIELCRKERRIELAYENHRYFDTRTWMIAKDTDNGPMYGMDANVVTGDASVTPAEFWKRAAFETRVFKSNHYLYPFSQRELDRNKLLTQNYGW